jgi:hypothetical protein
MALDRASAPPQIDSFVYAESTIDPGESSDQSSARVISRPPSMVAARL